MITKEQICDWIRGELNRVCVCDTLDELDHIFANMVSNLHGLYQARARELRKKEKEVQHDES